jgi:hypothetical protein
MPSQDVVHPSAFENKPYVKEIGDGKIFRTGILRERMEVYSSDGAEDEVGYELCWPLVAAL